MEEPMSSIGEYKSAARKADSLKAEIEAAKARGEDTAKLEKDLAWWEGEAAVCWDAVCADHR